MMSLVANSGQSCSYLNHDMLEVMVVTKYRILVLVALVHLRVLFW